MIEPGLKQLPLIAFILSYFGARLAFCLVNEHKAKSIVNYNWTTSDPMKLSEIWFEQCQAAREIEFEFGVPDALDYLIGEKFLTFVDAAGTDSDFLEELPDFIAEIKTIFEPWQLAEYLDKVRQTESLAAGPDDDEDDDDDDDEDEDEEDEEEEDEEDEDEDATEFLSLQNSTNVVFLDLARALLIGD